MRRRTAKKHIILPDPKFKDVEVTKFVNNLMSDGKKSIALNLTFRANERTLEDKEVSVAFDAIQKLITEKTDYMIRK